MMSKNCKDDQGWSTHKTEAGVRYHFNRKTGESSWTLPTSSRTKHSSSTSSTASDSPETCSLAGAQEQHARLELAKLPQSPNKVIRTRSSPTKVNIFLEHGENELAQHLGAIFLPAPSAAAAAATTVSFAMLRKALHEQLDDDAVGDDDFVFVRGDGVEVAKTQESKAFVGGSGRATLRVVHHEERRPSTVGELAVGTLRAVTDARKLPVKEVCFMAAHALGTLVVSELLYSVWTALVLIEGLEMDSVNVNGVHSRNEWVECLGWYVIFGTMQYSVVAAIATALLGREKALKPRCVVWLVLGFVVQCVARLPPLVFVWTPHFTFGMVLLYLALYAFSVDKLFSEDTNIGIQATKIILAYGVVFALLGGTGIQAKVKEAKNDASRSLWILLAMPAIRETGYFIIRHAAQDLNGVREDADVSLLVPFHVLLAWTNRFLITEMDTTVGVFSVVMLQAFLELVLRMTHDMRDRFVHCYVLRKGRDATNARFNNAKYRRFLARQLMMEQYVEYHAIIGAPVVVHLFSSRKVRLFFDLGYMLYNGGVNTKLQVVSAVLQLVCELAVDMLCVYVERWVQGVDVAMAWTNRFSGFGIVMWLSSLLAFIWFLVGFLRLPPVCTGSETFCNCTEDRLTYAVHQDYCQNWWERNINTSAFNPPNRPLLL